MFILIIFFVITFQIYVIYLNWKYINLILNKFSFHINCLFDMDSKNRNTLFNTALDKSTIPPNNASWKSLNGLTELSFDIDENYQRICWK